MADPIVVPNEGKTILLDYALKGGTHENYKLDLFVSNTTVANASTAADFTIASFTGYTQATFTASSWNASTIVSNQGNAINPASPWAFTASATPGSPQTCYGWIMRGATSGKILFGANFSTPRVVAANGDSVSVDIPISDATL
jgi:hypothetical protein